MAEVILAETTITVDVGAGETTAPLIGLTVGETYRIVWDGTEYTDTAVEATLMGYQAIVVGNTALAGGENSGNYPFLLGDVVEIEMGYFIAEDKSAAAHTVAIYTAESSEFAPNDIILKRYSGEEKVFKGVDVVRLTHASNEYTVPYTFGEAVENIPITLDLKDGDQTVTAPTGALVKSAVISKPINLTPENIRSGKVIAGVTGEFVGESEPLIVGTSEGAVALDWSAGDQIITPATDGKPFSPVTLEKPETLVPENVRSGIDVGGVVGSFLGDTEEKTVALNFANGAQTVKPSAAGKVLSAVNILKPTTLLPENIAKDINIAGIIGTFAGGGAATIKCGQIAGNNTTSLTINHYLFSVPDLFFIYMPTIFGSAGLNYLVAAFGISQKLYDIVSAWGGQFGVSIIHDGDSYRFTEPLTTTSSTQALHHATTTQITVGRDPSGTANDIYTFSGTTYYWIAIGGLT